MERYADEALVLGSVDYGEADRVVTLLTREHGKLSAFASGARKSKRRFAGALEPLTHLRARLVETRGSTMRLDGVDVLRSFHGIRLELSRIARALYVVELCRELTRDHQPHPELLALALGYLEALESGTAGPTSLLAVELEALALAGLMPRFSRCALCGGPPGESARFDADHGGAVCAGCGHRAPAGLRVPPGVLDALGALQAGARTPLPSVTRGAARELLNRFIEHQLGRRLKSVEFMRQVGVD